MTHVPPDNPAGIFDPLRTFDEAQKARLIEDIRNAPVVLRAVVSSLTDSQLDTVYKNWTIRQIVHHVADSHLHSIIRFKWALTEDNPTIKAYQEGDWVQLADCKHGDVRPALAALDGLHNKWVQLLESMTQDQYERTFLHPETGETVSLWMALNSYAWHGKHHTAQIDWLRRVHEW